MRDALSAEFYKVRHDRPLVCVPVFAILTGLFGAAYDHMIFDTYKGLELFALPGLVWLYFSSAAAMFTGYVIGEDFSKRTILNSLSAGVSRGSYYFSRLYMQFAVMTVMFGLGIGIHTAVRLAAPKGESNAHIAFFTGKWIVFMLVLLIQLWAYASLFQMICFLVRKQLVSMIVCGGLVYAEAVLRQLTGVYDLGFWYKLLGFAPARVLKDSFEYAAYDRVLEFGFLKFGLSAGAIIVVSSTIGCAIFCRKGLDHG